MQVYCFGELLIDLLAVQQGVGLEKVESFRRSPGGAPANVARDLAVLGLDAQFMGLLGEDPFGEFLRGDLADAGVGVDYLGRSARVSTPLAFLATLRGGRKQVSFAGMDGWATALAQSAELDRAIVPGAGRWLHVGGVASAWAELHHRQRALLTRARRAGWRTSVDVNYRSALYANRDEIFATRMAELISLADVVKLSEEETAAAVRTDPGQDVSARVLAMGAQVVAVTRGPAGATVYAPRRAPITLAPLAVKEVEPTGAGDAFMAGLIAGLIRAGGPARPALPAATPSSQPAWPPEHDLLFAANLANECGALAVTRAGAMLTLKGATARDYPSISRWKKDRRAATP